MNREMDGCRPAAGVLNASRVGCSECPFPFCVITEAKVIRVELREHLTRIMQKLGNSVGEIAKAIDVNIRSVYRYANVHGDTSCTWCDVTHSQDAMCRSDIYTVVRKDGQYVTILNRHDHATERELRVVECFIEYVFPDSIAERVNGGHDHWVVGRVGLEEAKKFQDMCSALNTYTLSLSRRR